MKKILEELINHKTLTREEARQTLVRMALGEFNQTQMAAFVTVYMMRSITVEELAGFRQAMLALCVPVDFSDFDPLDLVGTGGDGKDTFNISTLSAFVVAGAGQPVAKHGNVGVSSVCGSSNVMEALGYRFSNDMEKMKKELERAKITFLHAPLFHPAMKNIAPIRRELGMKTFFNILGPLTNPASVKKQVNGVFNLELARCYNYLLQESDSDYMVFHALDGYDEVSLTGEFKIFMKDCERVLSPEDMGLSRVRPQEIRGGDTVEQSKNIFLKVLRGEGTQAQNDVVVANSAMALVVGQKLPMADAVVAARESLVSGSALRVLKTLLND